MLLIHFPALSHLILCLLAALTAAGVAAQEPIFPENAVLEKLFEGRALTEGVSVAPDGMVYFSEITFSHITRDAQGVIEAGHIWKFDPRTRQTSVFRSPSGMSNGIKFDAMGRMVVAEGADYGGRRVTRTDMATGKSFILAAMFEGRQLNSPNDITIDEQGRIYFSDPRYLGFETIDQPVAAVYRIDPNGTLQRIITDAGKPNGVCVSPDQKTLYVVSNDNGGTSIDRLAAAAAQADGKPIPLKKGAMTLMAYDLTASGSASFRNTLVDYAPEDGPDGLVCDRDGNLYVAVRAASRPGICVYAPDGRELAWLPTEIPTNVGFGRGADRNVLYITAGTSLYRVKTNRQGYELPPR
ncbi:MAG: SMP-30/gluconolactonase/LRE family protein [Planctomycetota bacterium]